MNRSRWAPAVRVLDNQPPLWPQYATFLRMNAISAFSAFLGHALAPARAARYSGLAGTPKGQRKLLDSLNHDFDRAIRPNSRRGRVDRRAPCYAYHSSVGFGAEFSAVAEACDHLSGSDGWLIVLSDGSGGIYRPEARWDAEVEIVG